MYTWSDRGTNANTNGVRWGMHVKYGSNTDVPVYMVRIEPGTLQINNSGGQIGMWDYDESGKYDDNTYNCTYILSYVGQTAQSLNLTDSDGDGLPDRMETHGWMDTQGNVYYSKPNDRDSDGDGLSDGEEAGTWIQLYQMKYFQGNSNPNKIDSDDDGLDDPNELEIGTKPFNIDTDHDRLTDYVEVYGWNDSVITENGYVSMTGIFVPTGIPTITLNHVYFGTDPTVNDTDQDGYDDYVETNGDAIYLGFTNDSGIYQYKKYYTFDPLYQEKTHYSWYDAFLAGYYSGFDENSTFKNYPWYVAGTQAHDNFIQKICLGINFIPLFIDDQTTVSVISDVGPEEQAALQAAYDEASFSVLRDPEIAIALETDDQTLLCQSVKQSLSTETGDDNLYTRLTTTGEFSDTSLGTMIEQGIDVPRLDRTLNAYGIYNDFPGIGKFIDTQEVIMGF